MKKIIRLTEGDLHHMVRTAINEVLDGMDDTEKSYWLMRQRQQRPNTKSRTKTDYPGEFARKFHKDIYGDNNATRMSDGYWGANSQDVYDNGNDRITVDGNARIDQNGNFTADQIAYNNGNIIPFEKKLNFNYTQKPGEKTGQFYNYQNGMPQKTNASNVMPGPNFRNNVVRGLNRYNDLAAKYDRQRQSQQFK